MKNTNTKKYKYKYYTWKKYKYKSRTSGDHQLDNPVSDFCPNSNKKFLPRWQTFNIIESFCLTATQYTKLWVLFLTIQIVDRKGFFTLRKTSQKLHAQTYWSRNPAQWSWTSWRHTHTPDSSKFYCQNTQRLLHCVVITISFGSSDEKNYLKDQTFLSFLHI